MESTSTKDSDLAVTPALVTPTPRIEDAMREAGFRPLLEIAAEFPADHRARAWAGRPGLWGSSITPDGAPVDEVDLMVPESLAGAGRRSVRSLSEHGRFSTGRVTGLELCVLERDELTIEDFDDGSTRLAYVARNSGLLCAKAHKITDRYQAVSAGRHQRGLTIAKDTVDLWRCLATSNLDVVRDEFDRHLAHPAAGAAISEGRLRLSQLITDARTAAIVIANLEGEGITEDDVLTLFEAWRSL